VFDTRETERLKIWKDFRDTLEVSTNPIQDVAVFWSRAPFVSKYLDPYNPTSWPDPWKLILDNKFCDLAIALGMCYTISLTKRFKDDEFEIHMAMSEKENRYVLVVNKDTVLNWDPRALVSLKDIPVELIKIWSQVKE
jgi:hypothetical protein